MASVKAVEVGGSVVPASLAVSPVGSYCDCKAPRSPIQNALAQPEWHGICHANPYITPIQTKSKPIAGPGYISLGTKTTREGRSAADGLREL